MFPKDVMPYVILADTYNTIGNVDESLKYLNISLSIDPSNVLVKEVGKSIKSKGVPLE